MGDRLEGLRSGDASPGRVDMDNKGPDIHVQESAALRNDDGHLIVCKSWRSDAYTEPRALVFLAHGFGEHCHGDAYHVLAHDLASVGCYVFAHDHVGHGRSEGPRATIKSFDTYVDDILTHVDVRRTDFPGKPIYLIGHSMGGLLCALTVQRKPQDFAGMVLLGPLLGIDKEEATWFKNMKANVEAVELPFLIEHGSADKLCDPADSQQFFENAASEDKALKIINGAYHSLLTEPDGVNREVRKDIVDWISARFP